MYTQAMERFGPIEIKRTSRGKITKRTMRAIMASPILTVLDLSDGAQVLHDTEIDVEGIVRSHTTFKATSFGLEGMMGYRHVLIRPADSTIAKKARARELFLKRIESERMHPGYGDTWEEMRTQDAHNDSLDDLKRMFLELFPA